MKKMVLILSVLLLGNHALSKTCCKAADSLLNFYEAELEACKKKDTKGQCSKKENNVLVPIIDFDFGNGKRVTAAPAKDEWAFTYFDVWEKKSGGDITIQRKGEYSVTYTFRVKHGECSLHSINVSFLPDGKNERAREFAPLNREICSNIEDRYVNELKVHEQGKQVVKEVKYGNICHHAFDIFWTRGSRGDGEVWKNK